MGDTNSQVPITLNPIRIVTFLFSFVVVFVGVYGFNELNKLYFHFTNAFTIQLNIYFDIGEERSIPTYFSFIILLISSSLLYFIYFIYKTRGVNGRVHWLFLCFVFLLLAVDEAFMIHETFGNKVGEALVPNDDTGIFYFSWILPYTVICVLVLLSYLKFLFKLPPKTRLLILISGFVYVFGAIGMEIAGGIIYKREQDSTMYKIVECLEETLEMGGIVLFIYALLDYISKLDVKILLDRRFGKVYNKK